MDEYISNILDPKKTFQEFIRTKEYIPYTKEIDTDPQLELYEDGIMEAISLYNFYTNLALDYIVKEAMDLKEIKVLESFAIECINERDNLATLYDTQEQLSETQLDDEEAYKAPFCLEYMTTDYGSLVDKSGNEFITEEYIDVLLEDTDKYKTRFRKYLYNERIKTTKEVLRHYANAKSTLKGTPIKYYFPVLKQYKQRSIFTDHQYYFQNFMNRRDKSISPDAQLDMYFEFLTRLLSDKIYKEEGYTSFYTIIPVMTANGTKWGSPNDIFDYKKNLNPISCFYRMMKNKTATIKKEWKDKKILFWSPFGYFMVNINDFTPDELPLFINNIKRIITKEVPIQNEGNSAKVNTVLVVDKIEKANGITVNNLTGNSETITQDELEKKIEDSKKAAAEADKDELVNTIKQNAGAVDNPEKAAEELQQSEEFKRLIQDIQANDTNTVKISAARASRIVELNDSYMKSKTPEGKTVAETIASSNNLEELPVKELPVDSINEEWNNMESLSFNESYNIDADIYAIMAGFGDKDRISKPMSIVSWSKEDTSTSEDYIETFTFVLEGIDGRRSTLKFDVPKLINNRFMMLRGNDKTISNQLILYPIIKTDEDTVQIVSNYNKVFVYRYGQRSCPLSDKMIKASTKYKGKNIKFTLGDNSRICSKYDLPIDFIELASYFNYIEIAREGNVFKYYFNLDELNEDIKKYNLKVPANRTAVGIAQYTKDKVYDVITLEATDQTYADDIYAALAVDEEFRDLVISTKRASKYQYSRASILNTDIPVVVICSYLKGLEYTMKEAGIKYTITEKRPSPSMNHGVIKFKDGYIEYLSTYESELLMNGLMECNTEDYSVVEIVKGSTMWLDFLDIFGGRLKADGLDNFDDLMIDSPITTRACEKLGLPKTFTGALLYSNMLLADNKYNKHSDITGNRFRCAEIISGYVYKCVSKSYADYSTQYKKTGSGQMTMKQSAVIDAILLDPTASDLSTLTPLLEVEAANAVTFKGLSGMNSDRSYQLDKRTYDDSMLNVLAMSTGFGPNVGITRQATIDKNIVGSGGYIKTSTTDDMSVTKSFGITEAITPMSSTRDDPTRLAMTFIQTSKHTMNTKVMTPMLVSSGADQALAHLTSDTYAHKAKGNGEVVEFVDDEYMIVEYKDGNKEYIDLSKKVYKNSDGGFFITLQNTTKLKKGSKFKEGDVIAHDKDSFRDDFGPNNNLAFTGATLAKIAVMNTDDGFEDSCIISEWMSEALASDVVIKVPVILEKNTNVYNMVYKDYPIVEGDPLIVFQNAFDDEDANNIIKNITDDEGIDVTDIGRIPIRSKVTGFVQDVDIYRTVEIDELSESLQKIVKKYEADINKKKAMMKKNGIQIPPDMKPTYALPPTGKLKNAKDSVLIEFYLSYHDKLSIGDKITYYSALKGVAKNTFPAGLEPYTDSRPNEKIHSFLSISSINGRMVTSPLTIGSLNRLMIELSRSCKEIYDMEWKPVDELLMPM